MSYALDPRPELLVEIVDVIEATCSEEGVAKILNGTLDLPLLVASIRSTRLRREVVVTRKLEQTRVVPHMLTVALEHDALEIVVQERAWDAAELLEGKSVAVHEALELLIEREVGVHGARPAEHEYEAAEGATGVADLNATKASPVNLALLAR